MVDLEAALDELYAEPLDAFVSRRDEIAAALEKRDAARAVKALKKPSVGAWTLNQLVRRHPEPVAELLGVRDRLESASSATELRELSGRRRELVAELTSFAREILEASSHGASHGTLEKVSQGLLAGGTDEERDLLQKGRLTREPSASGLQALGFEASEPDGQGTPTVSLKAQREVQKLRREAERLQQEAARLAQEAAFAEEQARRARVTADEAASAADIAGATARDAAESAGL